MTKRSIIRVVYNVRRADSRDKLNLVVVEVDKREWNYLSNGGDGGDCDGGGTLRCLSLGMEL